MKDLKGAIAAGVTAAGVILLAGLFAMFVFHYLNKYTTDAIPAVGYLGSVWAVIATSFFGSIWSASRD